MELRVFEDFIVLADLRSFSRAAIRRNSTQSAFSRRIQNLEAWIGAVLVDRRANPLALTRAGEAFYELAQDSLRSIRHGCEEVVSIASQTLSTLSFAVTHSLSLNFFPRWIRGVEEELGPLTIRLSSNDGEKCRAALMNGECHFMIAHFEKRMRDDFRASQLKSLLLGVDRLIPVTMPMENQSPLAPVPGTSAARTRYLTYTSGSFMGRTLELFLHETHEPAFLQPCFETSLAEGVKAMVLEGHGVGWLPESIVRDELCSGKLVRAGGSEWDIEFEVRLFRPVTRLPKTAEHLWTLISRRASELVQIF